MAASYSIETISARTRKFAGNSMVSSVEQIYDNCATFDGPFSIFLPFPKSCKSAHEESTFAHRRFVNTSHSPFGSPRRDDRRAESVLEFHLRRWRWYPC